MISLFPWLPFPWLPLPLPMFLSLSAILSIGYVTFEIPGLLTTFELLTTPVLPVDPLAILIALGLVSVSEEAAFVSREVKTVGGAERARLKPKKLSLDLTG